jgi:hypothetical protein
MYSIALNGIDKTFFKADINASKQVRLELDLRGVWTSFSSIASPSKSVKVVLCLAALLRFEGYFYSSSYFALRFRMFSNSSTLIGYYY